MSRRKQYRPVRVQEEDDKINDDISSENSKVNSGVVKSINLPSNDIQKCADVDDDDDGINNDNKNAQITKDTDQCAPNVATTSTPPLPLPLPAKTTIQSSNSNDGKLENQGKFMENLLLIFYTVE